MLVYAVNYAKNVLSRVYFTFRSQAAEFYRQGGEYTKLVRCLYLLEDYSALEGIITELPEGHPLLPNLSRIFSGIGSATPAASALIKVGFAFWQ